MKRINTVCAFLLLLSCTTPTDVKKEKENECTEYSCPMHPDHTGTRSDQCPECGMQLEAVKTDSTKNK